MAKLYLVNHNSRRVNEFCICSRLLSYVCRFTNIIISITVASFVNRSNCITRHYAIVSVVVSKEMTGRQISPSIGYEIVV